ncbi:ABC transporter ATP-binding protein [bacterium 1XD42-54]|nr:ABC transporter ATP-binding protein [bacterium 1XD42-54]
MAKLAKYLKKSTGFLILIVGLLFLQAYCDLALPDYTSRIVNEGIQQKGIEDGVPEKLRAETVENLKLFLDEAQQRTLDESYERNGDEYVLKKLSGDEREALEQALTKAEIIVLMLTQNDDMPMLSDSSKGSGPVPEEGNNGQGLAGMQGMELPEGVSALDAIKSLPEIVRTQIVTGIGEKVDTIPEMMTGQYAIQFVSSEYEAMGVDLDRQQIGYIMRTGGSMILLALLAMAASVLVTFCSARVAAAVAHDLRNDVYRKVIGFTSEEFNHFSTASLITRSTNDIQQIQMLLAMGFRLILYSPILGIGGVLKVLQSDASMSWIIALAVALILLVILVLFKVAMPRFTKLQSLIDRVNLVMREILSGIMVTRAFSAEKHEEERFEKANCDLMKTNLFVNRCMTFMMPIMMLIMNGVSVLIIYKGSYAVESGSLQVGDMMAFIQYAMQIIMSFLMITMMSIMIPRANVAGKRIAEVLGTQSMIHDPQQPETPDTNRKGIVEFDHVSFAYPDADEKVLEDISFKAEKGQTVAFIGSTGSGKSTLINLIPRFFDVTEGSVRVDGVDVRNMTKKDLCSRLGYVPQKSILFSGTIDSNIRYGKADATQQEIEEAAVIAQAAEFIETKEEGYNAPIAQGGTNVSGGQKQRLSIARAIAKQPEILIFDDSFSALDYKTDVALRRALKEATADTTTLIVAQRISTILHADQIIVLDEGKIAGKGTHEELMKSCEVYRQIATSQLSEEELAG